MTLDIAGALIGALLAIVVHPVVGVCITGWALASLVFRGREIIAWFMGVLAGAFAALLASLTAYVMYLPVFPVYGVPITDRISVAYAVWATASFLLVGPVAGKLVLRRSPFEVFGIVSVGLLFVQIVAVWQFALSAGMGIAEYVDTSTIAYLMVSIEALGSAYSLPENMVTLVVLTTPATCVTTIGITGIASVARMSRIAERYHITTRRFPALASLDLPPLLTLLPIAGVALYAASTLEIAAASTVEAVGINVLLISRWVFFFQGLAVFAGLFERVKFAVSARTVGYGLLCVTEAFMPAVSLIGLADIWLNVRRLSREGAVPGDPGASSDRG